MTTTEKGLRRDRLYTKADLADLANIGRDQFARLKRDGLRVHYHGRVAYVWGGDLIDHIMETSRSSRWDNQPAAQ